MYSSSKKVTTTTTTGTRPFVRSKKVQQHHQHHQQCHDPNNHHEQQQQQQQQQHKRLIGKKIVLTKEQQLIIRFLCTLPDSDHAANAIRTSLNMVGIQIPSKYDDSDNNNNNNTTPQMKRRRRIQQQQQPQHYYYQRQQQQQLNQLSSSSIMDMDRLELEISILQKCGHDDWSVRKRKEIITEMILALHRAYNHSSTSTSGMFQSNTSQQQPNQQQQQTSKNKLNHQKKNMNHQQVLNVRQVVHEQDDSTPFSIFVEENIKKFQNDNECVQSNPNHRLFGVEQFVLPNVRMGNNNLTRIVEVESIPVQVQQKENDTRLGYFLQQLSIEWNSLSPSKKSSYARKVQSRINNNNNNNSDMHHDENLYDSLRSIKKKAAVIDDDDNDDDSVIIFGGLRMEEDNHHMSVMTTDIHDSYSVVSMQSPPKGGMMSSKSSTSMKNPFLQKSKTIELLLSQQSLTKVIVSDESEAYCTEPEETDDMVVKHQNGNDHALESHHPIDFDFWLSFLETIQLYVLSVPSSRTWGKKQMFHIYRFCCPTIAFEEDENDNNNNRNFSTPFLNSISSTTTQFVEKIRQRIWSDCMILLFDDTTTTTTTTPTRTTRYKKNTKMTQKTNEFQVSSSYNDCKVHVLQRDGKLWIQMNFTSSMDDAVLGNDDGGFTKKEMNRNVHFVAVIPSESNLFALSGSRSASRSKLLPYVISVLEGVLKSDTLGGYGIHDKYSRRVGGGLLSGTDPNELLDAAYKMESSFAVGRFAHYAKVDQRNDPIHEMNNAITTTTTTPKHIQKGHHQSILKKDLDPTFHCSRKIASNISGTKTVREISSWKNGKAARKRSSEISFGSNVDCPVTSRIRWDWKGETKALNLQTNRSGHSTTTHDANFSESLPTLDTTPIHKRDGMVPFQCSLSLQGTDVFNGIKKMMELGIMSSPLPDCILNAPTLLQRGEIITVVDNETIIG